MAKELTYKNIANQIDVNLKNLTNLKFLIESTSVLTASLDYEKTLARVAKLAVPRFADWCSVHIKTPEEERPEQIVVAHVDPEKVQLAKDLQQQYPSDPDAKTGVPQVLRTGQSEMMSEIPQALLEKAARDKEHLKMIRALGLKSYMCVPLIARQKTLGAITFVSAESGRTYTENDLAVVEDLARIAGIAIDNALLYKEAQDEIQKRKAAEAEITSLNQNLEKKVISRTTELERSNKELADFAYVASHDLQEPLRKIQSFGNLLKEEQGRQLSDDGQLYLDRILDASLRMRTLIDDILTFSRVKTKAQPFRAVDLNTIAKDVLSDLEDQLKRTRGTISTDTLPTINADPFQIRQLFQNIVSNSLKFHKKNVTPKISITSKQDAESVQVLFEDNGIGIDKKYIDKIFTIFERLHGRDEYEGTGIGLAVVKRIVDRHNGEIIVKSKPGKGTTFIIVLPRQQRKGGEKHE